jgi:HlyD family secretion protein
MDLFPEEIIKNTTEHLHAKYSRKSNVIYITVLLLLVVAIGLTPFIKVNVTRQSRGVIRSEMESNTIQTVVGGKIIINNIHENKNVDIGDTLLVIESAHIEESIKNHIQRIELNQVFISDIESLLSFSVKNLASEKYNSEYDEYLAQINQQKLQSEYLLNEKKISDDLFTKNVETKVDNNRIKNDYNASVKEEQYIHDQYQRKWNAELVLLQQENIERKAQIAQLREEKRKHIVISPIEGELLQVSGFQT